MGTRNLFIAWTCFLNERSWARKWGMRFQPVKCNMMQLSNMPAKTSQVTEFGPKFVPYFFFFFIYLFIYLFIYYFFFFLGGGGGLRFSCFAIFSTE